jgi:murein L,D-transpeptidase YcbB/YkuD
MERFKFPLLLTAALIIFATSCKKNDGKLSANPKDRYSLDSAKVVTFFESHPDFRVYKGDITKLYANHDNKMLWYDKDGRIDFAEVLYSKANDMENEGVPVDLPYKQELADVFEKRDTKKPDTKDDLLISAMYLFYTQKVYGGIDSKQSRSLGWFLPREKVSYVTYLDTLMKDPDLIKNNKSENNAQYYNLRKALQRYRAIEKKGGWAAITFPEGKKLLKPGDSDPAVAQVRKRLFVTGDISKDSGSAEFDASLATALVAYYKKQNLPDEKNITPDLVNDLNIPVGERIKTIIVNMERCRWVSPDIDKAKEYVAVNIPSFHLRYVRDGRTALESNVVVGKEYHETVVFSGKMSYLVFSPYWNIPKSIIAAEIKPGMDKDKNYLEKHHMEWNGGNIRQKPGEDNSLGLIKFMFPNTNNIYLHDSPAKGLFNKEARAYSHGCVRVQKAKELAYLILGDDKKWTPEKIDEAMHAGKESQYALKRKIPVYIAYFTASADADGNVVFYEDVYKRDARLAKLLYSN